jgi:hypothetical protein
MPNDAPTACRLDARQAPRIRHLETTELRLVLFLLNHEAGISWFAVGYGQRNPRGAPISIPCAVTPEVRLAGRDLVGHRHDADLGAHGQGRCPGPRAADVDFWVEAIS